MRRNGGFGILFNLINIPRNDVCGLLHNREDHIIFSGFSQPENQFFVIAEILLEFAVQNPALRVAGRIAHIQFGIAKRCYFASQIVQFLKQNRILPAKAVQ